MALFDAQCVAYKTTLTFRAVSLSTLNSAMEHDYDPDLMIEEAFPSELEGD